MISRNPQYYSVGMPLLFFYPVEDASDPHAVDMTALGRAYNGMTDDAGQVINGQNQTTCLTPEQILKGAYIGNLTSVDMGGEIKTVEHTASNRGRKVTDKVVVTRRSVEITCGFDEIDPNNLKNFFSGEEVGFPSTEHVIAKTTARSPQSEAVDFSVGPIELFSNKIDQVGAGLEDLERMLTYQMTEQGANFTPIDVAGTPVPLAGVYYFIIADSPRAADIETALVPYRNKILCGYFKYDEATGRMRSQAWPENMDGTGYTYTQTSVHTNLKQLVVSPESNIGIPSNDGVNDRTVLDTYNESAEWVVNATDISTTKLELDIPPHIMRNASRVILEGKRWDGSAWVPHTEVLFDATQDVLANDSESPLRTAGSEQYLLDPEQSVVKYYEGKFVLQMSADIAETGGDMDVHGLTEQTLWVSLETRSAEAGVVLWSGVSWGKQNDVYSTARVNAGNPDREGCAMLVFNNDIGVSFKYLFPRTTLRPDGTVDYSKEDWVAGGFILSVLKDDRAVIPELPSRVHVPFGYNVTYKQR